MTVYTVLNAIILGLSIATILITLVAFIIYQVRRLNIVNPKKDHGFRLESVFFRRHAPHIQEKIDEWEKAQATGRSSSSSRISFRYLKLGGLFGILAAVLIVTLVTTKGGREFVDQKVMQERAGKLDELKKMGLLKKKNFTPIRSEDSIRFIEPVDFEKLTRGNLEFLQKKKVGLIAFSETATDNDSKKIVANKGWVNFLKANKISYEEIAPRELKIGYFDILVVPQVTAMDEGFLKKIEEAQKSGAGIIFTGPVVGGREALANKTVQSWLHEKFGLSFWKNPESHRHHASQFVGHRQSVWDFSPGEVLPLTTTNNGYFAISDFEAGILAFETDFRGTPIEREKWWVVKAAKSKKLDQTMLWLAWDPTVVETSDQNERDSVAGTFTKGKADYLFSQALSYVGKKMQPKISWWPNGKTSAAVISVDTEYEFENIAGIIKKLNQFDLSATLFLVANMYNEHKAYISDKQNRLELASHSDEHFSFLEQRPIVQFDRIQTSRHLIEELSATEVVGFRPPYEQMDLETVHAVSENGLKYIFGDQSCVSLSPCLYSNNLVFIPRMLNDDFFLLKDRTLGGIDSLKGAMVTDLGQTLRVGGGYFLSLHTQGFGREHYLPVVEGILGEIKSRPEVFVATFSQMVDWWVSRRNLQALIVEKSQGKRFLQISNSGRNQVSGFEVFVGNITLSGNLSRSPASSDHIVCDGLDGGLNCKITHLQAGKTLEVPLE